MAEHHEELIKAARRLMRRRTGQRGALSSARIRRSVSTAYYALFHFVLDEAARTLVGTHNDLRRRRRTLARVFSHAGIKATLDRIRGAQVDAVAADLLRPRGATAGAVATPAFARNLASAFSDAQTRRHEADYDLNKESTEADARVLISRVETVIAAWRAANSMPDRDFKHALCLLMLLKGQLRREA